MTELVTVIVAIVGACGSIVAAYVARQAQHNTRPISNGFAGDVTRRLDRIESLIQHHIQTHADNDVAKR